MKHESHRFRKKKMAADRAQRLSQCVSHICTLQPGKHWEKRLMEGQRSEEKGGWLCIHYKLRKVVWVTSLFLSEDKTMMMIIITFDFFITSLDLAGILVNYLSLLPFSAVDGLSYQTGQQISKISNRKKLRTKTFPMEGSMSRDWEREDSRAVSAILLAHSCRVLQTPQVSC